jgi:hypothetical protein
MMSFLNNFIAMVTMAALSFISSSNAAMVLSFGLLTLVIIAGVLNIFLRQASRQKA